MSEDDRKVIVLRPRQHEGWCSHQLDQFDAQYDRQAIQRDEVALAIESTEKGQISERVRIWKDIAEIARGTRGEVQEKLHLLRYLEDHSDGFAMYEEELRRMEEKKRRVHDGKEKKIATDAVDIKATLEALFPLAELRKLRATAQKEMALAGNFREANETFRDPDATEFIRLLGYADRLGAMLLNGVYAEKDSSQTLGFDTKGYFVGPLTSTHPDIVPTVTVTGHRFNKQAMNTLTGDRYEEDFQRERAEKAAAADSAKKSPKDKPNWLMEKVIRAFPHLQGRKTLDPREPAPNIPAIQRTPIDEFLVHVAELADTEIEYITTKILPVLDVPNSDVKHLIQFHLGRDIHMITNGMVFESMSPEEQMAIVKRFLEQSIVSWELLKELARVLSQRLKAIANKKRHLTIQAYRDKLKAEADQRNQSAARMTGNGMQGFLPKELRTLPGMEVSMYNDLLRNFGALMEFFKGTEIYREMLRFIEEEEIKVSPQVHQSINNGVHLARIMHEGGVIPGHYEAEKIQDFHSNKNETFVDVYGKKLKPGKDQTIYLNGRIFAESSRADKVALLLVDAIVHGALKYGEGNIYESGGFEECIARKLWQMEKKWRAMSPENKRLWLTGKFCKVVDEQGKRQNVVHLASIDVNAV